MRQGRPLKVINDFITVRNLTINTARVEDIYPEYGLHPLQNGSEIRAEKTGAALHHC